MPSKNKSSKHDTIYMRRAIALAKTGQGQTGQNPSVGCVLVKDNHIIAAARTSNGGRPHAENAAIEQAGRNTQGATAYITLEPCAHSSETPSCAGLLIDAGIKRVVIGCIDPDPRTQGAGVQRLKDVGIEVQRGVLETQCKTAHAGFMKRIIQQEPFVTLKIASSIDGKIALRDGQSQWITNDLARRYAHVERYRSDALLTGVNTINTDNPSYTVRLGGACPAPILVILDNKLSVSMDTSVVQEAQKRQIWIVYASDPDGKAESLKKQGVNLIQSNPHNITEVLSTLAAQGVNNLMVEAGAEITTSFLKSEHVDRILHFRAPKIMGADSIHMVQTLDFTNMNDIYNFKREGIRMLGDNTLEIFTPCSQD